MIDNIPIKSRAFQRILLHAMRVVKVNISDATGEDWRISSIVRASPNHKHGWAFDLAPIKPIHLKTDGTPISPQLNRKRLLGQKLVEVKDAFNRQYHPLILYIFMESDHLHCQFALSDQTLERVPGSVFAWPYSSRFYPDETDLPEDYNAQAR